MTTSSNSSHASKRQRLVRKTPRRHDDPERQHGVKYDSGELPVLLRMPDVTDIELTVTSSAAEVSDTANASCEPDPSEAAKHEGSHERPSSRSRRRSKRHQDRNRDLPEETVEESFSTSESSVSFWRTMAPRIAIGGMLLCVLVMCGVMFMKPRDAINTIDGASEWEDALSSVKPGEDDDNHGSHDSDSSLGTGPWHGGEETIAANPRASSAPVAPSLRSADSRESSYGIPLLQHDSHGGHAHGQVESSENVSMPNAFVPSGGKANDVAPSNQPSEKFRAQSWPDEMEVSGSGVDEATGASLGEGPQLNPAFESAQQSVRPQARTSWRDTRGAAGSPGPAGNSAGTRLKGSVEVPTPRTGYR